MMRIGIVGGGFSGISLAYCLNRLTTQPLEISIFDQSGEFGAGPAYRTPFTFHLLNVEAQDMSIIETDHDHFIHWVRQTHLPEIRNPARLFLPRPWYREYLAHCIQELKNSKRIQLNLIPQTVLEYCDTGEQALLKTNTKSYAFDRVILALGNQSPLSFPFKVASKQPQINYPWDYQAPLTLPRNGTVLIVGTGLSMIDAVLTLHHFKHRGKILALSRHGLLPLPHKVLEPHSIHLPPPQPLKTLLRALRELATDKVANSLDWRHLFQAIKDQVPTYWQNLQSLEKKCLLRHLMCYWNIHRHRVHSKIYDILNELKSTKQLDVIAGRIHHFEDKQIYYTPRGKKRMQSLEVDSLINCMGPSSAIDLTNPLILSLENQGLLSIDHLALGIELGSNNQLIQRNGKQALRLFALGALTRAKFFDMNSVPAIRKHSLLLAKHLLMTVDEKISISH